MFDSKTAAFATHYFIPHGHCYLWNPGLVWLEVISNGLIGAAYVSITVTLIYLVYRIRDFPFQWMYICFATFIVACGLTHFFDIYVIWIPAYWVDGTVRAITAIASVGTAILLPPLVPKALALAQSAEVAKERGAKLEQGYEALRASEEHFRTLIQTGEIKLKSLLDTVLDTVVDGTITIDRQGLIQSFNPASARLFGYTPEEVLGENVRLLMPEPYRGEHDRYIENYLTTGKAKIIGIGRQVIGLRKDGSTFPMELAVGEVQDGGRHSFVGTIRDITERVEAAKVQEQLRRAQKMEAVGQLTGGVAHDFNNLLAIILGNLELLREQVKQNAPAFHHLEQHIDPCLKAAERGAALTEQLLAFGRRQALQPRVISINELVAAFGSLLRRTLGEHIEMVTALSPDTWNVKVDPGQLENALLNLAVNARDAMSSGGRLILETGNAHLDGDYTGYQVEEAAPGDYAMLAVSDNGTGMAPEVAARAFEPFFTTKEIGKGSGLGLSMVYGFVKQSAGNIRIYSEVGKGTSVKIYLPKAEGPAWQTEIVAAPVTAAEDPTQLILVVEDDKEVLAMTEKMLESFGYRVITAESGDAGLAVLEKTPNVALLLTDVMLPGSLSGPALAKRALELKPALKILFASGYTENAILENGLLERGVNLIGKPFHKRVLREKVRQILGASNEHLTSGNGRNDR